MTSKELILANIRESNCIEEIALPHIENFGIKFENKIEQFKEVIKTAGGEALTCDKNDTEDIIKNLYPNMSNISSNTPYFTLSNIDTNKLDDPHNLKNIDLAVVQGEFAVAENGAIWIKNSNNLHRVLYFIAQNIIIIVDKNNIVNNMHEAYEQLEFKKEGYGIFVSGPSKTADIEQSLVIGAHGPKSLYVIFV